MAKKTATTKAEPKIKAEGTTGSKTWSGHITTGPISIPVAMYAAARGERVSFNMLHDLCQQKVKQVGYYCPCCVEVKVLKDFKYVPERELAAYKNQLAEAKVKGRSSTLISKPREMAHKKGELIIMHADDVTMLSLEEKIERSEGLAMVGGDQTLKGFEVAKDSFVTFTKEELDGLKPESASMIEVDKFVKAEEVHPIYFESSYYLPADEAVKNKSYSMLRAGMIATGTVAVGQVCVRQSANTVFIYPHPDGGLIAYTAYLADEIRQVAFQKPADISSEELAAVTAYINAKTSSLDMADYHDTYRENVTKMVEAKQKGEPIKAVEQPKPKVESSDNLIEMFKASTAIALEKKSKRQPKEAA